MINMKHFLLLLISWTLLPMGKAYAQSPVDIGKIVVGVDIPTNSNRETLTQSEFLTSKISNWLAQYGWSSCGFSSFAVRPRLVINKSEMAEAGMKNLYVVGGSLYLQVVDLSTNVVFASAELPFEAYGTDRNVAIRQGLNKVSFHRLQPMLEESKAQIINYYRTQKLHLFAQAELLAKQGDYDQAIALLLSVPECVDDVYLESIAMANAYLEQRLVLEAEAYAQERAEEEAERQRERQEYIEDEERHHRMQMEADEQAHRLRMEENEQDYQNRKRLDAQRLKTLRKVAEAYYKAQSARRNQTAINIY